MDRARRGAYSLLCMSSPSCSGRLAVDRHDIKPKEERGDSHGAVRRGMHVCMYLCIRVREPSGQGEERRGEDKRWIR